MLNEDTCQQFKAEEQEGSEQYVINLYSSETVVINLTTGELLEKRILELKNLFKVIFSMKSATFHKECTSAQINKHEATDKTENPVDNNESDTSN